MAKVRGPDGIPLDVPSVIKTDDNPAQKQSETTGSNLFPDDPPTVPVSSSMSGTADEGDIKSETNTNYELVAEPKTEISGGLKRTKLDLEPATAPVIDPMSNPVAGWLVVIEGPGKGQILKLGYGQNSIGRGSNERVCLDFGDAQISRNNHATLTYDPRGNKFYFQQGSGTNLAYMNSAPVLAPTELPPCSHITLGATTLRFVPFCIDDFTWTSLEEH